MPRHSSTDIIIAAARDLAQALLHPSPTSPLLPIHDNHQQHLRQLSDIFSQHTGRPDIIPSEDPPPIPAALPKVQPSPAPFIQPPPPVLPTMAAPPVSPFPARWGRTRTRFAPAALLPAAAPMNAPLLRLVSLPTMAPSHSPLSASPPVAPTTTPSPKHITWATSVTGGIAPIATYVSTTINPGQRRRVQDRVAFLQASVTIHPGISSATWSKRHPNTRRSYRRKQGQRLPAQHAHHARCSH
jgi:hypothetical protein